MRKGRPQNKAPVRMLIPKSRRLTQDDIIYMSPMVEGRRGSPLATFLSTLATFLATFSTLATFLSRLSTSGPRRCRGEKILPETSATVGLIAVTLALAFTTTFARPLEVGVIIGGH